MNPLILAALLALLPASFGRGAAAEDAPPSSGTTEDWQHQHLLRRAAYLQTQLGRLDEAAEIYERLTREDPGDSIAAVAHAQLAAIQRAQGEPDRAKRSERRARSVQRRLALDLPPASAAETPGASFSDRLERGAELLEASGQPARAEALRATADKLAYRALRDRKEAQKQARSGDPDDPAATTPAGPADDLDLRPLLEAARAEGLSRAEIRQRISDAIYQRLKDQPAGRKLEPTRALPRDMRNRLRRWRDAATSAEDEERTLEASPREADRRRTVDTRPR